MADRRTRPFAPPTQQAGFGMMQQRLPFSAVQQHQMYPMMQQGFPTMPQGMMPQSYPAMFMAPTQPGQPPAGFVPGMMPGQQAMPPPPPYTQTLAENYRMKQQQGQHGKDQMTADQQRQSELLLRQRQFEQQQQKLRSMSALSGSKMNADSLIESILGKSKTSNCTLDTPTNISAVTATDDGFGDFMTGPTLSHDCHVTPAAPSPAMPVPTSVTTDQLAATSRVGALESDHPKSQDPLQTVNPPEPAVGEKKDQVLAMMLQCSDFSAPSKATTFVKKRPINESTPPPRVAVTFQSSQSAYRWNNSDKLTQLFSISSEEVTSPQQPVVPPNGDASKSTAHFVVPKWCTGTLPVPTIYTQVFEASTREGKIDINIVYMILIKSGLPREVLGHIWNLCNRNTPGELQMDELYLILAMIAIAQNNLSIATLDILHRCPQAPVPYLGQPVPAPPVPDAAPPPTQPAPPSDHHVPVSAPLVNMASIPEKPPSGDLSTPTVVPPVMVTPSVPPVGVTGVPSSVEENDFADFQCAVPAAESFGDFAVCAPGDTAESSATKTTSATDLIGPEDKYAALKASLEMPPQVLGAPEPPDVSTETPQDAKPSSSFADFDNAFDSSSEAKDTGDAFTANSTNPSALNPASDCLAEGFTTFQAAGSQSQASDHKKATNDKYSVLKSLVTNADLFQSEPIMPVVGSEPPSALEPAVGVDQNQGDFSTGNVSGKSEFAADNDGWDDFKAATVVKMKWSDVGGSEGAGNAVAETEANVGWETSAQMVEDAENTTMEENIDKEVQLANTIMSKVSTKPRPAKNYFARNVVRASAPVGLGISPLDTQPPDFPPDDDNDKDFDDFGTFRSSGADTSGSFSTLGCVDAFDDFGEFAKQPSVCAADSTSMSGMKTSSSHDFTGWGNQSEAIVDDVQSMKSLDFKAYPSSKTDSSASGDNQSVSSFDIATVDTARKVEVSVDDMSSSVDVVEKESMESVTLTEEENGDPGLFPNSESDKERHNDNETPQKPWDMGEMLTQGGLTALTSDRYSELSSRPQESDRHICEWTRCVDQCLKLLREANDTFNSISSSAVCHEVLSSQRGSDYIAGITEVYKVALRIGVASKSMALLNKDIVQSLKDVDLLWGNLCAFLAHSPVQPPSTNLGISDASLQTDNDNAQQAACGVCLLSVDQVSSNDTNSRQKLIYGVRQYHSSCANFWVNCVNSTLPALKIPELL